MIYNKEIINSYFLSSLYLRRFMLDPLNLGSALPKVTRDEFAPRLFSDLVKLRSRYAPPYSCIPCKPTAARHSLVVLCI